MEAFNRWMFFGTILLGSPFLIFFSIQLFREIKLLLKEIKKFQTGVQKAVDAGRSIAPTIASTIQNTMLVSAQIQEVTHSSRESVQEIRTLSRAILDLDATPVRHAVAFAKQELNKRRGIQGKKRRSIEAAKRLLMQSRKSIGNFYTQMREAVNRKQKKRLSQVETLVFVGGAVLGGAAVFLHRMKKERQLHRTFPFGSGSSGFLQLKDFGA